MATCVEQRTISFDNDIFALYLSLPIKYRFNGRIARHTLKYLDPAMAKVRTGNTNMPASASPLRKQLTWFQDIALIKAGLRKKSVCLMPAEERTWPDRDTIVRSQPAIRQAALDVCNSEALDSLGFLDMRRLEQQIHLWLSRPRGGGALLSFLITIDRFLKQ